MHILGCLGYMYKSHQEISSLFSPCSSINEVFLPVQPIIQVWLAFKKSQRKLCYLSMALAALVVRYCDVCNYVST